MKVNSPLRLDVRDAPPRSLASDAGVSLVGRGLSLAAIMP
jgi:hypothetical protein